MSELAIAEGTFGKLRPQKPFAQIASVRRLGKADMVRNDALPEIVVDPQTFAVSADGHPLDCPPVTSVPLNRKYLLR